MEVPLFTAAEVNRVRRAGLTVLCTTPTGLQARVYRADVWHDQGQRLERLYRGQRVGPDREPGIWMRVQAYYPDGALRWCVPRRVWTQP